MVDLRPPLLRALREEGRTEFDLYLDAVHPSAEGHRWITGALEEALEQLDWPPRK
jgi:lysophospholipase L1-like esterase